MRYTTDGQENVQITNGDEVVVAYAAGDADTGTVTGTVEPNGVYIQIEGKSAPSLFHVDSVSKLDDFAAMPDPDDTLRDDPDALAIEHEQTYGGHYGYDSTKCPPCVTRNAKVAAAVIRGDFEAAKALLNA